LLTNAATCLFDIMLDRSRVEEKETVQLRLSSTDAAELLLDWFRELLFLFSSSGLAVSRVVIEEVSDTGVRAVLFGERFDPQRHELKVEVKTPTYHQFSIVREAGGLTATVVLDV
jgi:SHS2 domain-containing protein